MSNSQKDPQEHLPLTAVTLNILLALADEERHGYGIMLEIEHRTDGAMRLGPGTLYGTIKRLRDGGMIEDSGHRPDPELDDERRRYYRLTNSGQQALTAEIERLNSVVDDARRKGVPPGRFPGSAPEGA